MVASALDVDAKVAQKYVNEIALKNLKEKKVVIFWRRNWKTLFYN